MLTNSCKKEGSSIVEAAMVWPLVILVVSLTITLGLKLYVNLRDTSSKHREETVKEYEIFEKGRILISFSGDNICITDDIYCATDFS